MATSIGTAWIQVKPTTKGLSTAIQAGLNGKQIGQNLGQQVSSGFATKLGAIAGLTQVAFKKIAGKVSEQFSGAISRVDTLNNFSNVMDNLNISTDASQKAISKLSEKLDGLPTPLDEAAAAVQRFTTKNNDIDKSTDIFLALNNALLAGGASAELQSSAMEQISQAYAKGRPDMVEWRSILSAMPAQSAQISKALLGNADSLEIYLERATKYAKENPMSSVGKELVEQLNAVKDGTGDMTTAVGTALRSGVISMDDFIETVVRLNKTGENGFKSFEEQAKAATNTIQTRVKNVSTSITKIIADALNGEDMTAHVKQLVERVTEIAPQLISGFSRAILGLAQAIPAIIPPLIEVLIGLAPEFINAIAQIIIAIARELPKLTGVIINNLPVIVGAIGEALGILFQSEDFLKVFGILATVFVGAKGFGLVTNKISGFISGKFKTSLTKSFSSMFESLGKTLSSAILALKDILISAAQALVEPIKVIFKGIGEAIAGFLKAFADPAILEGALIFVVAAGAIALAILMIGGAIGAVSEGLSNFVQGVILPMADFLANTLIQLIQVITACIIELTNGAIIPLGNFLANTFIAIIQTMAIAITQVTNGALIPLINTLSGAFTSILRTVADLITGVLRTALEGIVNIINAIGDGFIKMGQAIRMALDGARGVLEAFAGLLSNIADSMVAIVALATHQSVNYGRGFAHVTAAATGGLVEGIGTETSDSNLYALSKGEYVIRAAAAKRIGYSNLDAMNRDGQIGGEVVTNITINGYNKSPDELASIISRKIALKTQGVIG